MDEYIKNQATINIGTIGHVAHGKTTLVKMITGVSTVKYKSELERNITIKLGYANAKIYECDSKECPRLERYKSYRSDTPDKVKCSRKNCPGTMRLIRHVSFVDCPGHDVLMATMLTGTAIMDSAMLIVAANEPCPQPQTQEHLFAVEIMGLKNMVIVQNKIDLVTREKLYEHKEKIVDFVSGTSVKDSPIVPVASQCNVNIGAVLDFIVNYLPVPTRDLTKAPKMVIIRSFDVNKPGTKFDKLKGGVLGGSLVCGKLSLDDEIEIRPGMVEKTNSKFVCRPFVTRISSLKTEQNILECAVPGGLIGVGTSIDPFFCKSDKLVGMIMGLKGNLPNIYEQVEVEYVLFKRISISLKIKNYEVKTLKDSEFIQLAVGSSTCVSRVECVDENVVKFGMIKPVCCEVGEKVALSRKIDGHWRLIGYGSILGGQIVEPTY